MTERVHKPATDTSGKWRLAVVIPVHWAAFMGGSQFQAKLLIEHLAAEGRYDISYFAHRTDPGFQVSSHQVVTTRGWRRLRRYTDLSECLSLYRALKANNPQVIYQRAASGFTGIAAFYAKRRGCPMVWHVASDMEVAPFDRPLGLRSLPKWLEKKAIEYGLRNASHIVVQTEHQRSLLAANYGRTDAAVVRNFHPPPEQVEPKNPGCRVVWVANLKPIKQPEQFLALAHRMRNTGIEFTIIGGPSNNPGWQAEMDAQIAACPNVAYLGQLDQAGVNAELDRSHILVNTSRLEGFSNTFVQAWQRGVPVASLNVDADGLLDGRMGYCADGSLDRLVEIVSDLAANPARLLHLAQQVARTAAEDFSMRNAAVLADVIHTAVQKTAPQAEQGSDVEYQH